MERTPSVVDIPKLARELGIPKNGLPNSKVQVVDIAELREELERRKRFSEPSFVDIAECGREIELRKAELAAAKEECARLKKKIEEISAPSYPEKVFDTTSCTASVALGLTVALLTHSTFDGFAVCYASFCISDTFKAYTKMILSTLSGEEAKRAAQPSAAPAQGLDL